MQPILWLVNRIGPAAYDGMGGISASNILDLIERAYHVPQDQIGEAMDKIIQFISALREARQSKHG